MPSKPFVGGELLIEFLDVFADEDADEQEEEELFVDERKPVDKLP